MTAAALQSHPTALHREGVNIFKAKEHINGILYQVYEFKDSSEEYLVCNE